MALSLIIGPAHSGKVASLLERYRTALAEGRGPWLVVPRRGDVMRTERELAGAGALIGGRVSTFDGLFRELAGDAPNGRRELGDAGRALVVRRLLTQERFAEVARFSGVGDALLDALRDLDGASVADHELGPLLGDAVRAYRAELGRLGLEDQGDVRRRGLARVVSELEAWGGAPVFAHGFEDLSSLQLALLEALAGRGDVVVSLPYESGRAAYASLEHTVTDLAALARNGEIVEVPAAAALHLPPALAHLERMLFADEPARASLGDAIHFLEAAGDRGVCDLVAEEALARLRAGVPAEQIGIVAGSVEALRPTLEAACAALEVPLAAEGRRLLRTTPFGRSLLSLLRFAWLEEERPALYGHLRSPYAGLPRQEIDWVEGQLRGNAVRGHDRSIEVTAEKRHGRPLPTLDLARADGRPVDVARTVGERLLRNAHGLSAHGAGEGMEADLRAFASFAAALGEVAALADAGEPVSRGDVLHALDRAEVGAGRPGARGWVALLSLEDARTRDFDTVIVVGLEQGALPRRGRVTPLLDDDLRARLDAERGARLVRPDPASRDRYLFLTACTRARTRLVLARRAALDDGVPREPGPFWEAVRELYDDDDVRRATVRRPLSAATRELTAALSERERLRALAALAALDRPAARAVAAANGWERRLDRACKAFSRPTAITQPAALAVLVARESWAVSALDRMVTCSSAWFVERWLKPGSIDRTIDPIMRGSVAHAALQRFYQALPSAIPGAERVTVANLEEALALVRTCLAEAVRTYVPRDIDPLERRALSEGLQRDLERYVGVEATSGSTFVPRHLEQRVTSFQLAPGVTVSGKIDRVDVDPMSARGMVLDYKTGHAPTATEIERDSLLQVPLYLLVLRDALGLEPMGGVYVPIGRGRPRGMLRDATERVEGFDPQDYLNPVRFDEMMDTARDVAVEAVERIRTGDVRHDPRGGECPTWCDLWRMCRKARA